MWMLWIKLSSLLLKEVLMDFSTNSTPTLIKSLDSSKLKMISMLVKKLNMAIQEEPSLVLKHQLCQKLQEWWCQDPRNLLTNTQTSDSSSVQVEVYTCSALLKNSLHLLKTKENGKRFPCILYQMAPLPSNLCGSIHILNHCLKEELNGMQTLLEIGNNSLLNNKIMETSLSKVSMENTSASMRMKSLVIEMDLEAGNNSNGNDE